MWFAFKKSGPWMKQITMWLLCLCFTPTLAAAPAGPTLHLDYGRGKPQEDSICKFMYFVPLISPGISTIFTNTGNSQCARVLSFSCHTNRHAFRATCEFEFTGDGFLHNVFDSTKHLRKHEKELKAGVVLKHQLGAINVQGNGKGSVVVEGAWSNGVPVVNQVSIHFNRTGRTSPVTVNLHDCAWRNGAVQTENEMVARVNALTFKRKPGTPKMEVTLASIKRKGAGNNLWQNFLGDLKGVTANMFLPPLTIAAEGQKTMLDFGRALALEKSSFTFPFATRLKGIAAATSE